MAGQKGRSGNRAGNRTGPRGSKYINRPILDRETAQEIKILMLSEGRAYTPETVAAWLSAHVHALWRAYDAEISREADAEWEGQVL